MNQNQTHEDKHKTWKEPNRVYNAYKEKSGCRDDSDKINKIFTGSSREGSKDGGKDEVGGLRSINSSVEAAGTVVLH